ncbi:MAG: glycine zipper 2TM domain-containing protein [Burkholderiaceae bacterium]|nr:glycine zipper 2TM domain-containing protein [Burkholderiaceae bacterium]
MKMQTKIIASLLCLSALPLANAQEFEDTARVTSVRPHFEQVNQPRQECRTVYVPVQQERSAAGAIIGGIAGGILGNQVGRGSGRAVATGVGAVAGAVVGDNLDNRDRPPAGQVAQQECRTVDGFQQQTTGYEVTYVYGKRTFSTVLPYDPGKRVRVRVSVVPL